MQDDFDPHRPADRIESEPGGAAMRENGRLRLQLRQTRLRLLEADEERAALRHSNSWWITTPLRRFMQRYPGPGLLARKTVRALVLACRGELIGRLRVRWVAAAAHAKVLPGSSFAQENPAPPMLPFPIPTGPQARTILVVDQGVPLPDHFAGARVTIMIMSLLRSEGWSVTFWPFDRADAGRYARNLEALGISVVDNRFGGDWESWLEKHGPKLDHVMLMRPYVAATSLPAVLRHSDARLSYYGHDVHFSRYRQEAEVSGNGDVLETASLIEAVERRVWRAVDVVLYPSVEESAAVQRLEPGVDARALPLYAFSSFPPPRQPGKDEIMLFVGGFGHAPNIDAVCWFVKSILPLILAQCPHARFVVAGSSPPAAVLALAGPQVVVTGHISDAELAKWYASARVSVAPLRFGAGVKGKVVEALHAGLPVVTTSIGVQGLPGLADIVPVHDDAVNHAAAVLRLLINDDAWQAQAVAQVTYAEQHFSRETMRTALLAALAGDPAP